MDLICKHREAAIRLAVSRLADLENVLNDLEVASMPTSRRNSTVASLRTENSQLQGEESRLTVEVGSFQALCDELHLSPWHWADPDAKIDRLRAVLTPVRHLLDADLTDYGDQ